MSSFSTVSRRCLFLVRVALFKTPPTRISTRLNSSTSFQENRFFQSLSKLCACAVCGFPTYLLLKRSLLTDMFTVKALDADRPRHSGVNFLADIVEEAQPALVTIEVIIR